MKQSELERIAEHCIDNLCSCSTYVEKEKICLLEEADKYKPFCAYNGREVKISSGSLTNRRYYKCQIKIN
ncbi:hypothetical protein GF336_03945 [Candidatus Woesearchaeota archaeon]|nr:hypothetical protein [Candidatus Woesearchaeota archaeon]